MTSTLLLPLLIHLRGCLARNSIRHDQLGLFLSPLSTWEGFVRDSGTYLDQFCFDLADTQERDVVVHLAVVDGIDVTILGDRIGALGLSVLILLVDQG